MGSTPSRRTVAIWGSCVTRDAFALVERDETLADRLPLLHYAARSSWVSQASAAWPDDRLDLGELSGFPARMVREDLSKTIVDRLIELQPDLLVLDLVDERLPLVRLDKTWITRSDYFERTPMARQVIEGADEVSALGHPRRRRLFAAATRRLTRRLTQHLPGTTFVLNEAPYVTQVGDGSALPAQQATWARQLDGAQQPLLRQLAGEFGPRLVRATPPSEVRLADPDHRWGVTSYHYVPEYYHWLIDVLLTVPTTGGARRPEVIDLRPYEERPDEERPYEEPGSGRWQRSLRALRRR